MESTEEKKNVSKVTIDSESEKVGESSIVYLNHEVTKKDMDEAAKYDQPEEPMPPGMDFRLQLKADLFVTSFMAVVYGIQFADTTMNSAATTLNLREDLNITEGSGYAWSGSGFYLGYLVFVFPMSYMLMKAPLAKATGVTIIGWGITIMCTAACKNLAGFLALRVLLGGLESAIMPAYIVLTSQYYKRSQQFQRTLCWLAMNGLGTIISNSLAVGLMNRGKLPMSGWKLLYFILGAVTTFLGIVFAIYMPNSPAEAWFYSEEEKKWQAERIRENNQGYGNNHIKWYQVKEAFLDPHTWLYSLAIFVSSIPNGAITTMLNLLLAGFNLDVKQSLLMALPCGGSEIVGMVITAIVSSYVLPNHRMVWSTACSSIMLLCLCLVAWGPNAGSKLASVYIWYWMSPVAYVALVSCIESNSAGHTKKMTTNAIFYVFYCAGNITGPQTFKTSEAPEYPTGKKVMAGAAAAQIVLDIVIIISYVVKNHIRDKRNAKLPEDLDNPEFADLTDMENPEFRYAL